MSALEGDLLSGALTLALARLGRSRSGRPSSTRFWTRHGRPGRPSEISRSSPGSRARRWPVGSPVRSRRSRGGWRARSAWSSTRSDACASRVRANGRSKSRLRSTLAPRWPPRSPRRTRSPGSTKPADADRRTNWCSRAHRRPSQPFRAFRQEFLLAGEREGRGGHPMHAPIPGRRGSSGSPGTLIGRRLIPSA